MTPSRDAMQGGTTPPEAGGEELRLIVFRLEGEAFGLPLDVIQEVARGSDLRAASGGDPSVESELVLRGEAVPLVDLRAALGMEPTSDPGRGRIVVAVLPGGDRVGLLVDAVDGVRSLPRRALAPVPRFFRNASVCVRGVLRAGEELIVLLDPVGLRAGEPLEPRPRAEGAE